MPPQSSLRAVIFLEAGCPDGRCGVVWKGRRNACAGVHGRWQSTAGDRLMTATTGLSSGRMTEKVYAVMLCRVGRASQQIEEQATD